MRDIFELYGIHLNQGKEKKYKRKKQVKSSLSVKKLTNQQTDFSLTHFKMIRF